MIENKDIRWQQVMVSMKLIIKNGLRAFFFIVFMLGGLGVKAEALIVTLDFEGLENNKEINEFYAGNGVHFDTPWIASIKEAAGGSGRFDHEPSAVTAGLFQGISSAAIRFDSPVKSLSFFHANANGLILHAFNAQDTLIASLSGAPNYDGFYNTWHFLSLQRDGFDIEYVRFLDKAGEPKSLLIDDFQINLLDPVVSSPAIPEPPTFFVWSVLFLGMYAFRWKPFVWAG